MSHKTYESFHAFGSLLPGVTLVLIAFACWRFFKLTGIWWFGAAAILGLVSFVAIAFPAMAMVARSGFPDFRLPERVDKILLEMRLYGPSVLILVLVCFGFGVFRSGKSLARETRKE
jgi:hypothetical protein